MGFNLLLILVALLPGFSQQEKHYYVDSTYEMEYVYDFECDGLYYEFVGENDVYLVREKSVVVGYSAETIYRENVWKGAFYFQEANVCYTGDIVIPDSVEYAGKKYRVAGVNHYALAFSRDLKSVTFTSDIGFTGRDKYDRETYPFFYDRDLVSVVYPDDKTLIQSQLLWSTSLQSVHFPYKLTRIVNSLNNTGMTEVDLDNHGEYNPSFFSIVKCFDYSPNLKRVKFPECDTLSVTECGFIDCFKMEQIVFRPCKKLIPGSGCDIFYTLYHILDYPIKVVSEGIIPPVVDPRNTDDAEYRAKAILYVPDEAMETYRVAEYWQDFGEIRPMSQYLAEEAAALEEAMADGDDEAEVSLTSNGPELRISVSAPTEVTVWSLQGQTVWSGKVAHEAILPLPQDVYIVTTPKSTRKYRH